MSFQLYCWGGRRESIHKNIVSRCLCTQLCFTAKWLRKSGKPFKRFLCTVHVSTGICCDLFQFTLLKCISSYDMKWVWIEFITDRFRLWWPGPSILQRRSEQFRVLWETSRWAGTKTLELEPSTGVKAWVGRTAGNGSACLGHLTPCGKSPGKCLGRFRLLQGQHKPRQRDELFKHGRRGENKLCTFH